MRNEDLNSDSLYKKEQTIPLNCKNIEKHGIFKCWKKCNKKDWLKKSFLKENL